MTDTCPCFCTSMIWSSVHEKYDLVSPSICKLLSERLTQSSQKHHHHILISIALSQWKPNVAFWWHCHNHIHPMTHDSICHWVISSLGHPSPSSEISLRYPSLIDIDYMLSLTVDLKHFLCIQRSQNFVWLRVSRERHTLDLTITQPILLLHDANHHVLRYF